MQSKIDRHEKGSWIDFQRRDVTTNQNYNITTRDNSKEKTFHTKNSYLISNFIDWPYRSMNPFLLLTNTRFTIEHVILRLPSCC